VYWSRKVSKSCHDTKSACSISLVNLIVIVIICAMDLGIFVSAIFFRRDAIRRDDPESHIPRADVGRKRNEEKNEEKNKGKHHTGGETGNDDIIVQSQNIDDN
jgi:hypothetical protein